MFSFLLCYVKEIKADVVISTTTLSDHLPAFACTHLTQLLNRSLMHSHSLFLLLSLFLAPAPPSSVSLNKPQSRAAEAVKKCRARFQSLFPGHLPPPTLCPPPQAPSLLPTQNHCSGSSQILCNLNTCTHILQLIRFSMTRACI